MTSTDMSVIHGEEKFWDDIAEQYAGKAIANPEAYRRKLDYTIELVSKSDIILDIGCGTGSLAIELAPHASQVHSVDVSSEMIRIAKNKAIAANLHNIHFHKQACEEELPFADASFDLVCAYNILHLVRYRQATLRELFDLLKPGGYFVSSTPCLGEGWLPYSAIISIMRFFGKAPSVQCLAINEFTQEIQEAGFLIRSTPDVGAKTATFFLVAQKP